ncbi:UNVERIFIED_CONTAM: flagellar biosynthesis protein FlhG [Acetivibrio alkalicellulosi]
MMDQAEKLRQIIDNLKLRQSANSTNVLNDARNKSAKVITVTSGKGGVGKTNIAINMAIALSEMGKRVTIMDADLGLANIDVLLGIIPKYTLVDVIYNNKNIIEVLSDGPKNIKFVAGGSGIEELTKLDSYQLQKFVSNIALLDKMSDVILIDTGAGLSDSVMSFVMAADEVILVATPEPTSITDAYAMIKMVSNRDTNKTVRLIVNRAESINEANDIINKLTVVTEKFLKLKLLPLGYILQDDMVLKAVKMQQPFSVIYPKTIASKHIKEISKKLLEFKETGKATENQGIKGFVGRLINIING